jgi:hypothetical protein
LAQIAALIWGIKWLNVALIAGICYFGWLVYKFHTRSDNCFDVLDLLVNDQTRKADFSKISIIVFAALSVWTVVTLVQRDKPVTDLLLGVLGVFVVGRVASNIWGKPTQDTTETTATVTTTSSKSPAKDTKDD